MAPTKAIVALARKIATVLFAIARGESEFDPKLVRIRGEET
jgi:hypothetical protein